MTNRIDARFESLRRAGRKAFMPFLTAGDPDLEFTAEALARVAAAGADLIEVGFPFSDPIADGPVIQASYTRALDRGLKLDQIFATLRQVAARPGWDTPLVGMVSYSIIHRRGPRQFIEQALHAGLSGCVLPDLPGDEAAEFVQLARERDFKTILLVTPTTSPERAAKIVNNCSGFLYCVSTVGITGEQSKRSATLQAQLDGLRAQTGLPLCVGFGVSKPEHVREIARFADGVIVGSALVRCLEEARGRGPAAALDALSQFAGQLAAPLHEGTP